MYMVLCARPNTAYGREVGATLLPLALPMAERLRRAMRGSEDATTGRMRTHALVKRLIT